MRLSHQREMSRFKKRRLVRVCDPTPGAKKEIFSNFGHQPPRAKNNMTIAFRFTILLAVFVLALPAYAQEYIADVQQFGVAEGLSHREVNVILQDSRGFMWLGTPFGLNRFDGQEFRWWTKEKNGLPDNDIAGLAEDAEGDLWISTDYGGNGLFGVQTLCFLNIYSGRLRTLAEKFGDRLPVLLNDIGNYWYADSSKTIFFGTIKGANMLSWHPKAGFRVFPLPAYKSFRVVGLSARNTVWGIADNQVCLELSKDGEILQAHRDSIVINGKKVLLKGKSLVYEASANGAPFQFWEIGPDKRRKPLAPADLYLPADSLNRILRSMFFNPHTQNLWVFSKNYLPVLHPWKGLLLNFYDQFPELIHDTSIGFRGFTVDDYGRIWLGGDYGVYKIKIQKSRFRRYLFRKSEYSGQTNSSSQSFARMSCRGIVKTKDFLFVNTERNGL